MAPRATFDDLDVARGDIFCRVFCLDMPNLRGGVTYTINPKWEVDVNLGWLSVKIDNVDGDYRYFYIGTEYRITDHFGIGAAYQLADVDVTVDKTARIDK